MSQADAIHHYPSPYGIFVGVVRAVVGFPVDQFCARIEVAQQSSLKGFSAFHTIKTIWMERGIWGFLDGSSPKLANIVVKQSYRTVLEDAVSQKYLAILPKKDRSSSLAAGLTGVTVGVVDAYALKPGNRLFAIFTTRYPNQTLHSILTKNGGSVKNIVTEVYLGHQYLAVKQVTSWVTFLVAYQVLKKMAQEHSGQTQLPWYYRLGTSFGVGFINTGFTWPLATVLTQLEQANTQVALRGQGIRGGLVKFVTTNGVRKLYSGAGTRVVHCTIQAELYDVVKGVLNAKSEM